LWDGIYFSNLIHDPDLALAMDPNLVLAMNPDLAIIPNMNDFRTIVNRSGVPLRTLIFTHSAEENTEAINSANATEAASQEPYSGEYFTNNIKPAEHHQI
jgi:hypothetical protein